MPKFKVGDYEEVKELSAPLSPGTYECEVFDGKEKTSQKGVPMFAWQLKVVNDDNPENNGSILFYNTPLEGKGRVFLQQLYDGCGVKWSGEEVDLPEDLLGRTCMVAVNNYIYEGQNQAGVKNILPRK